ncbi:MAG: hypothetical protein M0Z30_10180, partial [Actinomycetota bacterium]|nr:hypothetical protein [Actinomycetota bacterium]
MAATALLAATLLVPSARASAALVVIATDDFNRANGSLGSAWTATSDGAMVISNDMVAGATSTNTGDIRTGETYPSDQYSQIQVTTTPTGGNWIAAAVRLQNNGQNGYVGLYFANFGNPELMLFKRSNGNWTQLGTTYPSGTLTAGTTITVSAAGSTITVADNTTTAITASDPTYSGGAPGIMADGTSTADNWSGGSVTNTTNTTTTVPPTTTTTTTSTVPTTTTTTTVPTTTTTTTVPTTSTTVAAGTGTTSGLTQIATDDFNRANGSLGSAWTATSDGAMVISNDMVAGATSTNTGD